MDRRPAQGLLERETQTTYGAVPHSLSAEPLSELSWQLFGDEFLLRGEGHHYFHYRKGRGVRVERGPGSDVAEEALWLNGSVYAAVASLNGLLPIHASAVAVNHQVFAFTGPAGAGKSTLVAALGARGLPFYCDDTLVLDLSDPAEILCLPGHKRLKLSPEALALTDAEREEKVSRTVDKFYARPRAGSVVAPLPLAELIFLEEGSTSQIAAITGAERIVRLQDDHYTTHLFTLASQFDRQSRFAHLTRLGNQISMSRFQRPRSGEHFKEGVALIERYVANRSRELR